MSMVILGKDRSHPALATLKERVLLTRPPSSKKTFHISLDLQNAPLEFQPGDSIGIFARNDPLLVDHLLAAMRKSGDEIIKDPRSDHMLSLREFLSAKANLARLTSSFLKLFYEYEQIHDKRNQLHHLLQQENKPLLSQYLNTHDPLDLFKAYQGVEVPLEQLCAQFGPLLPRFYSVASSPSLFKHEVHLTVALSSYPHSGEVRYGVASHFLSNLAHLHTTPIPVYVQRALHFALPVDDATPIIMVGPGTGVAPFRAFIQERLHRGATGKNWLFFGERNRQSDYLYHEFWENCAAAGTLKLDLAFSRDQAEKIYVQHKMLEQARELWSWLQEGAYFYVCGDAKHMAKDVEAALVTIAQTQGHMSEEAAKAYVKSLRQQKRYLADVY